MPNANNKYLFAAYTIVWIVFMLYAWSLSRRQSRLAKELEELKKRVLTKDEHPAPKV
ncbi:MAG: CcmD family protein [Terriglobia bacterium]